MTDAVNLKARLELVVKRRDELSQKRQRLLGRLEEAERTLEELRGKCRAKGIDPDNLDAVITKLETALEQSVASLETQLTEAEKALEPFTNRK
jgi:chromosome segregation ATPase